MSIRLRQRSALAVCAVVLLGCSKAPLTVVAQTDDQISVCRETAGADFQEAENMAASFCGDRRLMPKLAATATCGLHAVRYNYICRTPRF